MFAGAYFCARYFAPRFFPKVGAAPPETPILQVVEAPGFARRVLAAAGRVVRVLEG
jgi:hypothetical protein